jgi:glycosyltransferase involved in cell wall biosynthesis
MGTHPLRILVEREDFQMKKPTYEINIDEDSKKRTEYIVVCNFFNEETSLPTFLRNLLKQSIQPRLLFLINDGSSDMSGVVAAETSRELGFSYCLAEFPPKAKGNLDTIGRTWTTVQEKIHELISDVDFLAIADVDNTFPPDYFERAIAYMKENPNVGVVSGLHEGGSVRHIPMGGGKVTRTEVIQSFDKYWDIAPDSFINIKALKLGYNLRVLQDIKVISPPSFMYTRKRGRFRNGRISYYAGTGPVYAILRAIFSKGSEYLRGYWQEWSRGKWRCEDRDILQYYESEFWRKIMQLVYDPRRISRVLLRNRGGLVD